MSRARSPETLEVAHFGRGWGAHRRRQGRSRARRRGEARRPWLRPDRRRPRGRSARLAPRDVLLDEAVVEMLPSCATIGCRDGGSRGPGPGHRTERACVMKWGTCRFVVNAPPSSLDVGHPPQRVDVSRPLSFRAGCSPPDRRHLSGMARVPRGIPDLAQTSSEGVWHRQESRVFSPCRTLVGRLRTGSCDR